MRHIGFISTRIAGIDGVSHEIEKWADILERNGYRCFYCAGEIDRPHEKSAVVEEAHFAHPDVTRITQSLFGTTVRSKYDTKQVFDIANLIREGIEAFIRRFDIDCIIAENCLTIPMNIPLGIALTWLIAETGIPAIAHHHDFSWERERFFINAAGDFLQMSFPPVLPSVRHVVINSIALANLAHRRGVTATLIPNTLDFANPPRSADPKVIAAVRRAAGVTDGKYMVLQPTRVIPRKAIERAVDLVSMLEGAGKRLVISHPAGDEGTGYLKQLIEYAELRDVSLVFIDQIVSPGRAPSAERPFTIADVYQAADLITYPSAYEGFGNAFLETIYFRKPIVMNRYPVFIADIEPKGFHLCLMNGFVTRDIVDEIERILMDEKERVRIAEANYRVAAAHYSYEVLERLLLGVMSSFTL